MAELSTYIGIEPRTAQNASGSTIGRGLRVVLGATGLITLAPIGVRGDYITLQDIANNEVGLVAAIQNGGKAAAVASEAVNQGDLAYSAANGQVSKTAAGAVVMGRWTQATALGKLGELEMFVNPAT